MTDELVRYDAMCRAIAEAHAIDEVKDMRDKARALEAYARQAQNTEAERQAREIRGWAERRVGELLKELARTPPELSGAMAGGPGKKGRTPEVPATSLYAQALAENRLTRQQASEYQRLADVPEDVFERELKTQYRPTAASIIYAHTPTRTPPPLVSRDALWVWGRLRDFERDGVLDQCQHGLLAAMTAPMRADTLRLAPRVADWLNQIGEQNR